MDYELLIFDFDGTLADTFPWFVHVFNDAADTYGLNRLEQHDIETLRSSGVREVMQHLAIPWWKLTRVARHMRRLAEDVGDNVHLFSGIDHVLHTAARNGTQLAVVTSSSHHLVTSILGPDIAPLVRFYECKAPQFKRWKRFSRIIAKSGVAPDKVLVIGDDLRDVEGAARVGVAFGAVGWGVSHFDALKAHRPAMAFERVDDLLAAVS